MSSLHTGQYFFHLNSTVHNRRPSHLNFHSQCLATTMVDCFTQLSHVNTASLLLCTCLLPSHEALALRKSFFLMLTQPVIPALGCPFPRTSSLSLVLHVFHPGSHSSLSRTLSREPCQYKSSLVCYFCLSLNSPRLVYFLLTEKSLAYSFFLSLTHLLANSAVHIILLIKHQLDMVPLSCFDSTNLIL